MHLSELTGSTPRVKPNVNYGLWMIMMCQCRFMDYNKCAMLTGDVDSGVSEEGAESI